MKDQTQQIAENFIRLLPLVYNRMNKPPTKTNPTTGQTNLTHLQQHILEELSQMKDGISITRLARNINISKQQLTPIMMKLEELEYVSKTPDPRDKRAVRVLLTDEGREALRRIWEEFHRIFTERIACLPDEDRYDLDYALGKIIRIFERMKDEDITRPLR